MAKKLWYSTPLKNFWDDLYRVQKKETPEIPDDLIFQLLRRSIINQIQATGGSSESSELLLSGLQLWWEDLNKRFLHIFFLEKRLLEFLENTPLSDLEGIRKYLYDNGAEKDIYYIKTKGKTKVIVYTFGLHIPFETNGYAFSISLYEDNAIEIYFSHGDNNGLTTDKFYIDQLKKKDEQSVTSTKLFRLAINTLAYMKCFPECVTDGVPKITIEKGEKRSDMNLTFSISEKITESDSAGVSRIPHFRKGYFRLLQSDYFKNKKGQVVYVEGTMVKGNAKTVSTSENTQEFTKNNGN